MKKTAGGGLRCLLRAGVALVENDAGLFAEDRFDAIDVVFHHGTRASPNVQKTSTAWNVFKEEFIKRQQQSDIQRRLAFVGIAAPTKTHRYPNHLKIGQRSLRDFSPSWSTGSLQSMLTIDSSATALNRLALQPPKRGLCVASCCAMNGRIGGIYGRKETRQMCASRMQLPVTQGPQVLQSILRERGGSLVQGLRVRAYGVCCRRNSRCSGVIVRPLCRLQRDAFRLPIFVTWIVTQLVNLDRRGMVVSTDAMPLIF